jgi:hypothetical protein
MSNRREELLKKVCGKDIDGNSAKYADATTKIILGDMGKYFVKFWETEGPGVLVMQPKNERSMFWLTLEELHAAREESERQGEEEMASAFQSIVESAAKIDPMASAGYLLNDEKGMRYFVIDYNKTSE